MEPSRAIANRQVIYTGKRNSQEEGLTVCGISEIKWKDMQDHTDYISGAKTTSSSRIAYLVNNLETWGSNTGFKWSP